MNPALQPNPADHQDTLFPSLLTRFQSITDPRMERNKDHELLDILLIAICAVMGGADSWCGVVRFGRAHEAWFRTFLTLKNGIPSHDTFTRVFSLVKPCEIERCFSEWMVDACRRLGLDHVAVDGKTMRGSGHLRKGLASLHVVSAFATAHGVTLGQCATEAKSNEITAIPQLLRLLDISGSIVTIDALGCQKKIARTIVDAEADYVLAVKENQPGLYEDLQTVAQETINNSQTAKAVEAAQTTEKNRDRVEKRTCYVITDLAKIRSRSKWKGLKAIGVVVSERTLNGETSIETRYYISSRVLSAGKMLEVIRSHWGIENSLHWVLDVVFGEDDHLLRNGHGPLNFTLLRRLALALIKSADMKEGIKGAREMAGWNTAFLEKLLLKSLDFLGN
jgi:predicted transposase YbfD/YdcC